MEKVLVFMTARDMEEARRVAEKLVGEGLCAGVNILPGITSVYRWKGEIRREPECCLLAQTRKELMHRVEEALKSVHSYECPALACVDITGGSPDFLQWIADMTA